MGDRWELHLRCDWCGEMNRDVWYAPSSNAESFVCQFCDMPNAIEQDFVARKIAPNINATEASNLTDSHTNTKPHSKLAQQTKTRKDK